jgi:hypothetical protein
MPLDYPLFTVALIRFERSEPVAMETVFVCVCFTFYYCSFVSTYSAVIFIIIKSLAYFESDKQHTNKVISQNSDDKEAKVFHAQ